MCVCGDGFALTNGAGVSADAVGGKNVLALVILESYVQGCIRQQRLAEQLGKQSAFKDHRGGSCGPARESDPEMARTWRV